MDTCEDLCNSSRRNISKLYFLIKYSHSLGIKYIAEEKEEVIKNIFFSLSGFVPEFHHADFIDTILLISNQAIF